jgi:hypothetical protein
MMSMVTTDRRSERRKTAEGDGILSVAAPLSLTIRCRLLDTSDHGFRASHDCAELLAGTQVKVESALTGKVTARVIWTAIMGDHIESGFYILS